MLDFHLLTRRVRALACLVLSTLLLFAALPSPVPSVARAQDAAQQIPVIAPGAAYRLTTLVSDWPGIAPILDPLLVNPWGISLSSTSPFWVANAGTSTATLYRGDVGGSPLVINPGLPRITIPGGLPTGTVFNPSTLDFVLPGPCANPPCSARFLFASITGNITGWNPNAPAAGSTTAVIATNTPGSVYTGLAIGNNGTANFLYAADFANGKINVFNTSFALQSNEVFPFNDPTIPNTPGNRYHPFNIQAIGSFLYVTYAKVGPGGLDEEGIGNGYVRRFSFNGVRDASFAINNGPLNSPWAVALAPASFGVFSNALLVGNFGRGNPSIHAFSASTGAFLGTLQNEAGVGIVIDELWDLKFGNGGAGGDPNTLYFAAGIGNEEHGLFGSLKPTTATATSLIQFADTNFTINEGAGHIDVTVVRLGDASNAATINYTTFDTSQPGRASQKSDYEIALGRLSFAPGETSKTFRILIVDDRFSEGDEVIELYLSNPTGTGVGLGSPNTAQVNIADNDTLPPPTLTVRSASGTNAAAITAARDQFRTDIGGGTTAGSNGSFGGVRREINWDGVPQQFSAPNNLPADFFNVNSPRGAVFSTPGTGFQVSGATTDAGAGQPAAQNFGNINASYTSTFQQFSPQRLFTALGSNVTTVNFFVAGTNTPATVSSFGAIFTDVDNASSTTIQYFDATGILITTQTVPAQAGSGSLSFLGLTSSRPIRSVRITSGNAALGPNDNPPATDVVVMDDFIYSEPQAVSPVSGPNPIDEPPFFVRQQYLDFLNREPDPAGLAFWTNEITSCGSNAACIEVKRINVSAAFFLSIEFQQTGFLAYRTHRAAYGDRPLYGEFMYDTQALSRGVVIGQAGAEAQLEANKQAYFNDFVTRPEFVARYPASMTNEQYVDALLASAGLLPSQVRLFVVQMTNDQESPPAVPTKSTGGPRPASFGTARLLFNDAQTSMTLNATVFNIDFTGSQTTDDTNDNLTNAHIHANSTVPPPPTRPVVWGFIGTPFNDNNPNDSVVTPFTSGVGGTVRAKWDAPEGQNTTLAAQLANLREGRAYINFHSTQFPGGEVRGNIPAADSFRNSLIAGLNSGSETRATVLRKVAEAEELALRERNPAFVLMQYFGYLRRDPDEAGFNFWLNKLNSFGGDFIAAEMVKAFITSGEYRQRFGPS